MSTIINCTPHPIHIGDVTIEPSGILPRAVECAIPAPPINGIPTSLVAYGEIEHMPAPAPDTYYVVSAITAAAAARVGRTTDILVPGGQIRDGNGFVVGCTSLGRSTIPHSYPALLSELRWHAALRSQSEAGYYATTADLSDYDVTRVAEIAERLLIALCGAPWNPASEAAVASSMVATIIQDSLSRESDRANQRSAAISAAHQAEIDRERLETLGAQAEAHRLRFEIA